MGFMVTAVTFFEETGVVDGFAEDFEVVFVTGETDFVDGFTVLLEDSFLEMEDTNVVFPVGSVVEAWGNAEDCLLEEPAGSSLSTTVFSSASTSSAPKTNTAQPPRAPSPIVLRAGRDGLEGPRPRWRRRRRRCWRERPFGARARSRPLPPRTPPCRHLPPKHRTGRGSPAGARAA